MCLARSRGVAAANSDRTRAGFRPEPEGGEAHRQNVQWYSAHQTRHPLWRVLPDEITIYRGPLERRLTSIRLIGHCVGRARTRQLALEVRTGVLVLAGGAAFAASWFVGQVTGGAGGNVAAAAGWERATLK